MSSLLKQQAEIAPPLSSLIWIVEKNLSGFWELEILEISNL